MSLQFFAPAGVKPAGHKKQRDDGEVDDVSHGLFQFTGNLGFVLKLFGVRQESRRAGATPLLHRWPASQSGVAAVLCHRSPKSLQHFVRSFGNPGCCEWDTRAPCYLPVESNRVRSCPHHDATPARRLIKRWAVGVKNVLRNDLSKKTLPAGQGISLKMQRD